MSKRAKDQLRAAWDEMIGALQEAREGIDVPDRMPAPGNDRNLAEGYRYLMGFFHFAVERAFCEDPVRPHFRNALSIINRSTIDNPDAIYFYAPIEGRRAYTLRGEVGRLTAASWAHAGAVAIANSVLRVASVLRSFCIVFPPLECRRGGANSLCLNRVTRGADSPPLRWPCASLMRLR